MKKIGQQLRRLSSKRARSFFRREFPLLEYLVVIVLGQIAGYLMMVCAERSLGATLTAIFFSLFAAWKLRTGRLAFLAGVILMIVTIPPSQSPPNDRPLLAIMQSDPRSRAAGRVEVELALYSRTGERRYGVSRCRAIHLPWKNIAQLRQGDQFLVLGRFMPIQLPWNPFSYDSNLRRHGFSSTCSIQGSSATFYRKRNFFSGLRESVFRNFTNTFGSGDREGVFLSMVLGYRDLIRLDTFIAFQSAGLAHLLVVSGYHVTLLFSSILFIIRQLLARVLFWQPTVVSSAFLVATTLALAFVAFIGADSANVRASVATMVVAISMIGERGGGMIHGIMTALFFLMIIWPGCFMEPGVQLTFAALIGIAYGLSLRTPFAWLRYLSVLIAPSLTTLGITVIWFESASIVGFVANPLLAPAASAFFTVGGIAAIGLYFLGLDSGGLLLTCILWILGYFRDLVHWIGSFPFSSVAVEGTSAYVVGGGVIAATAILLLRRLDQYLTEMGIGT